MTYVFNELVNVLHALEAALRVPWHHFGVFLIFLVLFMSIRLHVSGFQFNLANLHRHTKTSHKLDLESTKKHPLFLVRKHKGFRGEE